MLRAFASSVDTSPENEITPKAQLITGPGSWDHAPPVDQMKAIDMAMRWYFESEDWLDERRSDVD